MAIKGLDDLLKKYRASADMTTEQFETELNKALATDWIPKEKFNAQADEIKTLKSAQAESAKLLKELQEKANLSDEYKQKVADAEGAIKTLRFDYALERGVSDIKAKNPKDVAKLLDRSRLTLKEDGTLDGLEDQIKELKASSAYLFDEEEDDQGDPNKNKPNLHMGGGRKPGDPDSDFLASIKANMGLR